VCEKGFWGLSKGYRVLFLDEAIFSFNTFTGRAWSHAHTNFEVTEEHTAVKTQALLAVVSVENGVDHYGIYPKSVNN